MYCMGEKKKGAGGGRWLGGSLLAAGQGFVRLGVGWDVRSAGSGHIPEVLAAEGENRPPGPQSSEKAFHSRWAAWADIVNPGQHFPSKEPQRGVLGRASHPIRGGEWREPRIGTRASTRILRGSKPCLPIVLSHVCSSLPQTQLSPRFTEEGMKNGSEPLGAFHI